MFAYIIAALILATVITSMVFVIIGKIEHKRRHININWVVLMISIILGCALVMVIAYHRDNDLTQQDIQQSYDEGYNQGYEKGSSEKRNPTNEEMEQWFSTTQEVLVGTNNGGDVAVHIIDHNGEEWVLYADSIQTK